MFNDNYSTKYYSPSSLKTNISTMFTQHSVSVKIFVFKNFITFNVSLIINHLNFHLQNHLINQNNNSKIVPLALSESSALRILTGQPSRVLTTMGQ